MFVQGVHMCVRANAGLHKSTFVHMQVQNSGSDPDPWSTVWREWKYIIHDENRLTVASSIFGECKNPGLPGKWVGLFEVYQLKI